MEKQSCRKSGVEWIGGGKRNEKENGRSIRVRKHKREMGKVTRRETGRERPVTNYLKRTESSFRPTTQRNENTYSHTLQAVHPHSHFA